MSIGGVSSSSSAASYLSSPAVQLAQFQNTALSTLLGGASGEPSDLTSLTPTLVASSLYQQPGLLTGLTQWDGSMTPGSQRTAAPVAGSTAAVPAAPANPTPTPMFSFNPFDEASWWTDPTGSTVNTTA